MSIINYTGRRRALRWNYYFNQKRYQAFMNTLVINSVRAGELMMNNIERFIYNEAYTPKLYFRKGL